MEKNTDLDPDRKDSVRRWYRRFMRKLEEDIVNYENFLREGRVS